MKHTWALKIMRYVMVDFALSVFDASAALLGFIII